jgi:hypothetical protein
LGKKLKDSEEVTDPNIYEDTELVNELNREKTEIENTQHHDSNVTTFKSLYSKERAAKKAEKALLGKRKTKDKAIKFLEHEKLLNFMGPENNSELLDGRDDIIKNLFGMQAVEEEEKKNDQSLQKGKKKLKLRANQQEEEGDDIELF